MRLVSSIKKLADFDSEFGLQIEKPKISNQIFEIKLFGILFTL